MEVYPDGVLELVYALSANRNRLWDRAAVKIKLEWAESDKKRERLVSREKGSLQTL